MKELVKEVKNLKENVEQSAKTIAKLRKKIKKNREDVQTSLTHVFFSVGLTHAIKPTSPQVIVFEKVWSNVGGGYSSTTGVFTCPVAGFYSFTVNLQTNNEVAYLTLQHNNKGVFHVFTRYDRGHHSATNSAIIKLSTNDTVRVAFTRPEQDFIIHSNSIEFPTTFSGNLLSVA